MVGIARKDFTPSPLSDSERNIDWLLISGKPVLSLKSAIAGTELSSAVAALSPNAGKAYFLEKRLGGLGIFTKPPLSS